MKFKNTSTDYQSSVTTGKKMGFAPEAESFLMDMMSDGLYSDKYGSIVREVTSNAFDANVEGGKSDKPVSIEINRPNSFTNKGELVISDCGPGISPERVDDIFTLYFASTKRDDNEMIGGFGIGAKSPFAYTNVFRVETWCKGVKYTYLLEKRGQDRTCTLLTTTIEEGEGTKIRIPIKDTYDYEKFVHAVNEQTLLMRPLVVTISEGDYKFAEVVEFKNFYVARHHDGRLVKNKLALGNVVYDFEPEGFFAKSVYGLTIIPKLEIGKVMPTMSRESLQITDDAREYITTRCAVAIAELQEMIDETSVETDSILEAMKDNSGTSFTLPNTDITLDLKFGGYRSELVTKQENKLIGFEGTRGNLRSYLQSVVKVNAQYTNKHSGTGKTWRGASKCDSHRYSSWVVGLDHRNWNDENPMFIRWKAEDKLTPADKEYIEERFNKTSYTSIHFIQRKPNVDHSVTHLAAVVGGLQENESSEELCERVFQTYGLRILKELMGRTESFEDWRATPEYIQQRKEAMKELRTKSTKKDRSKTQYRLRGIGGKGVYDFELKELQRIIGRGVIYMTSKQLEELKTEHKESNASWQTLSDYVASEYETKGCSLFVVSAKAAKEFKEMEVFTDFESYRSKVASREGQEVRKLLHWYETYSTENETFWEMRAKSDPSFAMTLNAVKSMVNSARKRGFTSVYAEGEHPKQYSFMSKTVSIAPLMRTVLILAKFKVESPFMYDAIIGIRNWHPTFDVISIDAFKYIFPNRK